MTQNVEAIESAGQMRSIGLSKRFDMQACTCIGFLHMYDVIVACICYV